MGSFLKNRKHIAVFLVFVKKIICVEKFFKNTGSGKVALFLKNTGLIGVSFSERGRAFAGRRDGVGERF